MTEASRRQLSEIASKELLSRAGIPVVDTRLARTMTEAVSLGRDLGFPVALKIASADIIHKTDSGGVKLGLANAAQVKKAYREIIAAAKQKNPAARIDGVSVQKMARPGVEVIIGMSKDPQFGPVLMFGLGGILVEVLKDVAFRIVPATARDAREMIQEIKGYPLLKGYRGQEPADIAFLEKLIVRVSEFIETHPEVEELDLNPIFAYQDGAVAVDARVIVSSFSPA